MEFEAISREPPSEGVAGNLLTDGLLPAELPLGLWVCVEAPSCGRAPLLEFDLVEVLDLVEVMEAVVFVLELWWLAAITFSVRACCPEDDILLPSNSLFFWFGLPFFEVVPTSRVGRTSPTFPFFLLGAGSFPPSMSSTDSRLSCLPVESTYITPSVSVPPLFDFR